MDTNFEQIIPWNGANDTGKDVRLKWQRNFDRIKANFEELSDLFEKVNLGTDEAPAWAIRAKYGLYTDDWISAKGLNPDSPAEVSGVTELSKLTDVLITDLKDGQILAYDKPTDKWVNRDAVAGGLDETKLAEYLTTHQYTTQEWITQQGYATQEWANGQFAKATVAINAGTGLTGGGNLTASRTLSLATVGTAGTYTKVTVDAYGRVTGHQSLAAADIPTLSISKVSGLQSALNNKLDASDFSDLFEKVALSGGGYAIRAKHGLYSDDWLSVKGANPSAGGAVAGVTELSKLTDVTISNPQDGQGLVYRNGEWVNALLETGASSWSEITGKPTTLAGYGITDGVNAVSVAGSGNAITEASISGHTLTLTKGITFLRPLWENYMYVNKSLSSINATNGSANAWNKGDNDALKLSNNNNCIAVIVGGTTNDRNAAIQVGHNSYEDYANITGNLYLNRWGGNVYIGTTLAATVNSNVASATRLQTARTLWGQAFNGTANVSGSLSSVTDITMNGRIYIQYGGVNAASLYSNWARGLVLEINGKPLEFSDEYLTPVRDAIDKYDIGMSNRRYRNIYAINEDLTGTLKVSGKATFNTQSVHNYGILTSMIKVNQYLEIGDGRIWWDSSNGALYVQKSDGTSCGFYATGFVSAKGGNPDAGGAVSGASSLDGLSDVALSNIQDGQVLAYDTTTQKWVNKSVSAGGLDEEALAEYLTDNQYAKKGDISIAGLTDLHSSWGALLKEQKPTTLAGYGIADGVNAVSVTGSGNVVTSASVSGHVLTLTKGVNALTSVSLATISDLHSSWDAVLKAQKPAWLTTVSLATISDLHASWDALLKAAPSAYVTRWPTAAEVGALTQSTGDARYVKKAGDTMTGLLTANGGIAIMQDEMLRWERNTDYVLLGFKSASDSDKDSYFYQRVGDNGNEYFKWQQTAEGTTTDLMTLKSDALRFKNNTIWHAGNDGSGSGLDADLLDGKHLSEILSSNVDSATRLQTARTLWGQPFNGTANVSGSLSSVTDITMSGSLHVQYGGSNAASIYSNWERGLVLGINGTLLEFTDEYCAPGNDAAGQYDLGMSNRRYGNVYAVNEHLTGTLTVSGQATFNTQSVHNYGILTSMIKVNQYLEIGSGRLYWDSTNNALYVQKSDGSACGFYATGFISAKGANDDGGGTEATVLTIADERDATIYPDTYAGRGIRGLFRANATDGLNDGGTYHTVLHIRQWANSSGGLSHQLAFTDNGGVWHRTATSETAWGEWSELSALSGLGDVPISSPVNGQALIYRDGVWKNETVNYGITMDVDWDDVKNKPAWIGSTKPSYSFSEITGTPSVTVSSSSSTNLSVNVEGASKSVTSLYATYLGGTTKQGLFTGMTYSGNKLSVTVGGTTKSVTINAGGGSSLANVSDDSSGIVVKATSGTFVSIVGQSKPFYIDSQSGQTVGLRFEGNAATGVGVNMEAFKPLSAAAGKLYLGTSAARWRTIYSVNSLNTSSDLRLKDVRAAIPLTVAQVAAAPSFLYRWKKGGDKSLHAGSSAQYWLDVLPAAVLRGEDGYLAMEYDRIALASAIAVARTVTDHEERIKRLEKMIL